MRLASITLATALFIGAAASPADAQRRPDPAKRMERRVEMMTKHLDLSADQATRIRAILAQQSEQMKAFMANRTRADKPSPEVRDSMRQQMKEARQRTHTAISEVLTADQRKKFEEMKERGGERKRHGPRERARRG